jgi:hypothetical protein
MAAYLCYILRQGPTIYKYEFVRCYHVLPPVFYSWVAKAIKINAHISYNLHLFIPQINISSRIFSLLTI